MTTIVSYGGGTNSTAMLVGLHERGQRPDAITFADTGDEKPHTYEHIKTMDAWCISVGFPNITIVRGSQPQQVKDGSLSAECLRLGVLPSKAYGFGGCSQKWKIDPQNKFDREFANAHRIALDSITRLIGFDADEPERADRAVKFHRPGAPQQRFPLIEWRWGRDECIEAITRAGLPQPGKSSCYFCPSSRKLEIRWLAKAHPDLMSRALEIESRALTGAGPAPAKRYGGLGRTFAWADVLALDQAQCDLFSDHGAPEVDCGCYDG